MVCPSLAHWDLLQQIQQGDWRQANKPGGKLRGKEKGECFLHLGNGFFSTKRVRGPCKWRRVARIVHSKEALVWYYSCHCTAFNDAHLPFSLSLSLSRFFQQLRKRMFARIISSARNREGESDTSFCKQNGRPLIETDLRIHNQAEKHNSREVVPWSSTKLWQEARGNSESLRTMRRI